MRNMGWAGLVSTGLLLCPLGILQANEYKHAEKTIQLTQTERQETDESRSESNDEEIEEEGTLPQGQGRDKRGPDGQQGAHPIELHEDEVYDQSEYEAPDESQTDRSRLEELPQEDPEQ